MPIPPLQPAPLVSGRVDTELSGGTITLGEVTINDPATGNPIGTTGGALDVAITSPPSPIPVTVTLPTTTRYLAAGSIASLTAAGGTQALPAALATTRLDSISLSIIPTAALAGASSLVVSILQGATTLWTGVVTATNPPGPGGIPNGILTGGTALTLSYGANSGSLALYYTITGVSP